MFLKKNYKFLFSQSHAVLTIIFKLLYNGFQLVKLKILELSAIKHSGSPALLATKFLFILVLVTFSIASITSKILLPFP